MLKCCMYVCLVFLFACQISSESFNPTAQFSSSEQCKKGNTEIWVAHGQSNIMGEDPGPNPPEYLVPPGRTLDASIIEEYKSEYNELVPYDTTDHGIGEFFIGGYGHEVLHAQSKKRSWYYEFAKTYHELTGVKLIAAPVYKGATAITQEGGASVGSFQKYWMNFNAWNGFVAGADKIAAAKRMLPDAKVYVFMYAGEYDAYALNNHALQKGRADQRMSKAVFKAKLKQHILKLKQDYRAEKVYAALMHYLDMDIAKVGVGIDILAEVQLELSREMPNDFAVVYDTRQDLQDFQYHNDGDYIHLNDKGLDKLAHESAVSIATDMGCLGNTSDNEFAFNKPQKNQGIQDAIDVLLQCNDGEKVRFWSHVLQNNGREYICENNVIDVDLAIDPAAEKGTYFLLQAESNQSRQDSVLLQLLLDQNEAVELFFIEPDSHVDVSNKLNIKMSCEPGEAIRFWSDALENNGALFECRGNRLQTELNLKEYLPSGNFFALVARSDLNRQARLVFKIEAEGSLLNIVFPQKNSDVGQYVMLVLECQTGERLQFWSHFLQNNGQSFVCRNNALTKILALKSNIPSQSLFSIEAQSNLPNRKTNIQLKTR